MDKKTLNENPFKNYLASGNERFDKQMEFIAEIDKMTHIMRQTFLLDKSRRENDAEHSWHLAVMAQLLGEYCTDTPDINKALRMVTVHDIIEIYAGDTFAYDTAGYETKAAREKQGADKIFSILPEDQSTQLRALWEEFEARLTADSRFANCLDRIQPFFHNTLTQGGTWLEHKVSVSAVQQRMDIVRTTMPVVWEWVQKNIEAALQNNWLLPN